MAGLLSRRVRRLLDDANYLYLIDRTEQQLAKLLGVVLVVVMVVVGLVAFNFRLGLVFSRPCLAFSSKQSAWAEAWQESEVQEGLVQVEVVTEEEVVLQVEEEEDGPVLRVAYHQRRPIKSSWSASCLR